MFKISLIGGGSGCFSVGLVRELCASGLLGGCTVSLMDINRERLDAVYELCLRYTKEIGGKLRFEKTTDRVQSLKGADFIINTALAAPHQRLKDGWKIAEKYGFRFGGSYNIMYAEAFWINFYQLRFFEELTRDILTYCPDAWHLMVANPVISGTTYLLRKYPDAKMVGLCHGYAHAYRIAEELGCGRDGFTFQMSGPNHFVWLNKGHVKDGDFFEVLDKRLAEGDKPPLGKIHTDFYRRHGVVGIGDTLNWTGACWPWFYHADEETEREFNDYVPMDGWNRFFNGGERAAADIIALAGEPDRSVREFLGEIGGDELIVPLVESLACNVPAIMFVNVLNKGGLVPGVPEDFAIEVQALCQRDEIRPIQADPLPREMVAYILRDRVAPVEMELEAFRTGRMYLLEELVLMDKWAASIKQVRGFIQEIMELPYHSEMKAHYK
jgi:alpha-galactosidase